MKQVCSSLNKEVCTKNLNCKYSFDKCKLYDDNIQNEWNRKKKGEPPKWIKKLEKMREECYGDQINQGGCYLNNYPCMTLSGVPIPLTHHGKEVLDIYNSANGKKGTSTCKNVLLPCTGKDKPCEILEQDDNYNLHYKTNGGKCISGKCIPNNPNKHSTNKFWKKSKLKPIIHENANCKKKTENECSFNSENGPCYWRKSDKSCLPVRTQQYEKLKEVLCTRAPEKTFDKDFSIKIIKNYTGPPTPRTPTGGNQKADSASGSGSTTSQNCSVNDNGTIRDVETCKQYDNVREWRNCISEPKCTWEPLERISDKDLKAKVKANPGKYNMDQNNKNKYKKTALRAKKNNQTIRRINPENCRVR